MEVPRDVRVLAAIFGGSGVLHLARPQVYEPIMPERVPAHREVILASGAAELVCAAALLHPRTSRFGGWASLGLLIGVYPANLKMAGDALQTRNRRSQAVALGRLPLQFPMIRTAWRAAQARG